ncbi:MAG: fibronectin type III domain-containing protein [Flavobacteriales bacterium]|nr:fibronectin type III domain-containing protein [Flavobacteriales bacterium]
MAKVKTDLRNKNAQDVLGIGRGLLARMTADPAFPAPDPPLATLDAACEALLKCILEVEDGGSRAAYLHKNLRQQELTNIIRELAAYVTVVAKGDPQIIHRSGFEVARPSTHITSMNAPMSLVAKSGTMPCTIKLSWKPVRGTRFYNVYFCKGNVNDERNWHLLCATTSSRYLATDLDPLQYYAFRVDAHGANTSSPVSDLATGLSIGTSAA